MYRRAFPQKISIWKRQAKGRKRQLEGGNFSEPNVSQQNGTRQIGRSEIHQGTGAS